MLLELCDICNKKEADKRFKVKKSDRCCGWNPYEKIAVCEDCGEKLLGIKSRKTILDEIAHGIFNKEN